MATFSLEMASLVILGSLDDSLPTQEIMNNQTDQENQFQIFYGRNEENDFANPTICAFYFVFLATAVLVSILSQTSQRRREQREFERNFIFKKSDKPPSYKKIFFSDDPPQYSEIIHVSTVPSVQSLVCEIHCSKSSALVLV